MKKILHTLGVAAIVFAVAGIADVYAIPFSYGNVETTRNITVFDEREADGYVGQNEGREDDEVEPPQATGQRWDLEGMFLDYGSQDAMFTMVGGYDFLNGTAGQDPGDLFIDIDGDAVFGVNSRKAPTGKPTWGYEFAIRFHSDLDANGTVGYSVFQLDAATQFDQSGPTDVASSTPWKVAEANVINTGRAAFWAGLTDDQTGFSGWGNGDGSHYALQLSLQEALLNFDFNVTYFHYTMECGNDDLIGYDPVPEPGTVMLLGAGLLGLVAFGRKRAKK